MNIIERPQVVLGAVLVCSFTRRRLMNLRHKTNRTLKARTGMNKMDRRMAEYEKEKRDEELRLRLATAEKAVYIQIYGYDPRDYNL